MLRTMQIADLHPDAPTLTITFQSVPSLNLLTAICTVVIGEEHDFSLLEQVHVLELLTPDAEVGGEQGQGQITVTGPREVLDRLAEFVDTVTGKDEASHPWPQGEFQIVKPPEAQGDQG